MSKRMWMLAGIAVIAGLLALLSVTAVFAQGGQGPNPNPVQTPEPGSGQRGPMMGGRGIMGGRGMMGGRGQGMMGNGSLVDIAAEVLGKDRATLVTEMQTKSLADIAGDATKLQTIKERFLATRRAWLQELVANGRLTQEQANQMLATMSAQVDTQLNTAGAMGRGPRGDRPENCPMNGTGTCPGCGQPGQPGGQPGGGPGGRRGA